MKDTHPKYNNWPENNAPENTSFYVSNEIEINAPVSVVFAWMKRVEWFPKWYKVWQDVKIINGNAGPDIDSVGNILQHKLDGFKVKTTIIDFQEHKQIAWTGNENGMNGVHTWIFIERGEQCYVRTEETLKGIFIPFANWFLKRRISKWHDNWLSQLKHYSEMGHPDKVGHSVLKPKID